MINLFWYSVGLVIGFGLYCGGALIHEYTEYRADQERLRRRTIEALKEKDVYPGKGVRAYCMCEKCNNHRFVSDCALSQIEVNESGRCKYFIKRKRGNSK
jgi:hypothetical protein